MNINHNNFSVNLPPDYTVQPGQTLPNGVTVDPATQKMTIDFTKVTDSIELANFLETQGLQDEYIADMGTPQIQSPATEDSLTAQMNLLKNQLLTDHLSSYTKEIENSLQNRIDELKKEGVVDTDPRLVATEGLLKYYKIIDEVTEKLKKMMALVDEMEKETSDRNAKLRVSEQDSKLKEADQKTDWQKFSELFQSNASISNNIYQFQSQNQQMRILMKVLNQLGLADLNQNAPSMEMMQAILILLMAVSGNGGINGMGMGPNNLMLGLALSGGFMPGLPPQLLEAMQMNGPMNELNNNMSILAPLLIILLAVIANGSNTDITNNTNTQSVFQTGNSIFKNSDMDTLAQLLVTLLASPNGMTNISGTDQQDSRLAMMMSTILAVLIFTTLASTGTGGTSFDLGTNAGNHTPIKMDDVLKNLSSYAEQLGLSDESIGQVSDFITAINQFVTNLQNKGLDNSSSSLMTGAAKASALLESISLATQSDDLEGLQNMVQQLIQLLHQLQAMMNGGSIDLDAIASQVGNLTPASNDDENISNQFIANYNY